MHCTRAIFTLYSVPTIFLTSEAVASFFTKKTYLFWAPSMVAFSVMSGLITSDLSILFDLANGRLFDKDVLVLEQVEKVERSRDHELDARDVAVGAASGAAGHRRDNEGGRSQLLCLKETHDRGKSRLGLTAVY